MALLPFAGTSRGGAAKLYCTPNNPNIESPEYPARYQGVAAFSVADEGAAVAGTAETAAAATGLVVVPEARASHRGIYIVEQGAGDGQSVPNSGSVVDKGGRRNAIRQIRRRSGDWGGTVVADLGSELYHQLPPWIVRVELAGTTLGGRNRHVHTLGTKTRWPLSWHMLHHICISRGGIGFNHNQALDGIHCFHKRVEIGMP